MLNKAKLIVNLVFKCLSKVRNCRNTCEPQILNPGVLILQFATVQAKSLRSGRFIVNLINC